jgi:hypothetical protein
MASFDRPPSRLADPLMIAYADLGLFSDDRKRSWTTMLKFRSLLVVWALLAACASQPRYTDPFSVVDQNRDDIVEWREFKAHYPEAAPKAFLEADRNKDGDITPNEWQYFVEMHTP